MQVPSQQFKESSLSKCCFFTSFLTVFFFAALAFAQSGKKEISLEELLKTNAAHLFQLGEYPQALEEFQKLANEYPQDSLPHRYVGMTLTLLGRLDEAVTALQEAVKLESDNPANHYFLARVYHEQGARDKAESELNEVLKLDPKGFYGEPARQALPLVTQKKLVYKPWDVFGSVGWEYDSNVTLEPNDKGLGSPADQSAGRSFFSIGGTYRYIDREKFDSKAGYRFYQSLHDDSLNEFNYDFHEWSNVSRYRFQWQGREITSGLRFALPLGFLDGNLFVFGAEVTAFFNSRLSKNTFTEIYHSYTHNEFGPDGSVPRLTSRDGEYNASGIYHRFYFSNFSRYVFGGYEFQTTAARGDNFDRDGHSFRVGFHTPLFINKLTLEATGSFVTANYPHYSAELFPIESHARLDNDWTYVVSLTYQLNRNWSFQTFFRQVNANNKNDIFQYDRLNGGAQFLFRY